ncbi:hypothetical protein LPB140_03360 [Sphingorhabdus lutea]|uniref:Uncharacterized protein n=1 Tax=Sphingorhabdus lutea TaxID=1913578 RepID=A0A1L3JA58_9SPHN|nr:hypothetical protein LPB140_03360 [Sphingorhabdus lutea]
MLTSARKFGPNYKRAILITASTLLSMAATIKYAHATSLGKSPRSKPFTNLVFHNPRKATIKF